MLARPHELFAKALNMQYAIGAFNISNLEFAQAIVNAAAAKRSPIIVQTSEGAIDYGGVTVLAAIVKELAAKADIPVVLHLDHGKSFDTAKACIEAGYTSVMIDLSKETFEDNIRHTREVVDYAHQRGVWVEAELGAILGAEGAKELAGGQTPDEVLTDPKQAAEFVTKTQVDALAVSVGTIHGAFTGQEYIRFELLHEIEQVVPNTPLVLHGASGISDAHLKEAVATNVCKVNVDTEMRLAFEQAVGAYFKETHDKSDPREIMKPGREAVEQVVTHKIDLFGSGDKA